jgi:biotin operon repressor
MDPKSRILSYLSRKKSAGGAELRQLLRISRQATNAHLRSLTDSGLVAKSGSTRGARYHLSEFAPPPETRRRYLQLKGLDEGAVYDEMATWMNLESQLRPNVRSILHYAFTEMLNNAIEHSESDRASVSVTLDAGFVTAGSAPFSRLPESSLWKPRRPLSWSC